MIVSIVTPLTVWMLYAAAPVMNVRIHHLSILVHHVRTLFPYSTLFRSIVWNVMVLVIVQTAIRMTVLCLSATAALVRKQAMPIKAIHVAPIVDRNVIHLNYM